MNESVFKSPIIFYKNSKNTLHNWMFETDFCCQYCRHLHAYSSYACYNKCGRCGKTSDFDVVMIENTPVSIVGSNNVQNFQDEYDSLKIALALLGYTIIARIVSSPDNTASGGFSKINYRKKFLSIMIHSMEKSKTIHIGCEFEQDETSYGTLVYYDASFLYGGSFYIGEDFREAFAEVRKNL